VIHRLPQPPVSEKIAFWILHVPNWQFALLLGLALSAYSFLAGALALARPGPGSERLGETARRAGIATFALVFLAAVVLVTSAFQEILDRLYLSSQ